MGKGRIRDDDKEFYEGEGDRKSKLPVGARISLPGRHCSKPHYMNVEMFSLNGRVMLNYVDVKFYYFGKTRRFRPVVRSCTDPDGLLVEMHEIQTDADFFAQEEADKR